jgi:hypothetical protein
MPPPRNASQPLIDLHEALDAIRELTAPWVPAMAQARLESRLMDAADAGRDLEAAANRAAGLDVLPTIPRRPLELEE